MFLIYGLCLVIVVQAVDYTHINNKWKRSDNDIVSTILDFVLPINMTEPNPEIMKEAFWNTSKRIGVEGYSVQEHPVLTKDNLTLTMFRIPKGKRGTYAKSRTPVLLLHGMGSSSECWVYLGSQSFAFALADSNYDVWLGNFRGNIYSMPTKKREEEDPNFWHYSLDTLASLDLPAMTDYILTVTGHTKLLYVGHSVGATVGLAMLADKPAYNSKLIGFIAMAPIATGNYLTTPFKSLAPLYSLSKPFVELFNFYHIVRNPLWTHLMFYGFFEKPPNLLFILTNLCDGLYHRTENMTRTAIYVVSDNVGFGYNEILQGYEILSSGRFQHFDPSGTNNPPPKPYNYANIVAPVALFMGPNDVLSSPLDLSLLTQRLPNVVRSEFIDNPLYFHFDFVRGENNQHLLYNPAMKVMNEMIKASEITK